MEMNIFGLGTDVAPCDRFAKIEQRDGSVLMQRLFRPDESDAILEVNCATRRSQIIAASFAVKEAVYKALGTGLIEGMSWRDVEVHDALGNCSMTLHGRTKEMFNQNSISHWQLSCSATSELAIAVILLFSEITQP